MKKIFASAAIAMTLCGTPVVSAQDAAAIPKIVVTSEFQKDWSKGSKLETDGLSDLETAKSDLAKFGADVVNAQTKRDNAQSRSNDARQTFESLTARPYFSDPDAARSWAKQVEDAASDWAKYDARADDGASELRKATKRRADAQQAVDKAQGKVDRGRKLMAEAEGASLRQASR